MVRNGYHSKFSFSNSITSTCAITCTNILQSSISHHRPFAAAASAAVAALSTTEPVFLSSSTGAGSKSAFQLTPPTVSTETSTHSFTSTSSGVSKRGLAYNDASLTSAFSSPSVSWAYNWASSPNGPLPPFVEFVPMLWGLGHTGNWNQSAKNAISSGSTHLLSFNEPDLRNQANIDAYTAAESHIAYLNPFAGAVRIGSPAVSNSGQPGEGLEWLNAFLSACAGRCAIDFVAFHWYSGVADLAGLQGHVQAVSAVARQNNIATIWLTEFGLLGSSFEAAAAFIPKSISYLNSVNMLERYAYFMCADGILMAGHQLSALGQAYIA